MDLLNAGCDPDAEATLANGAVLCGAASPEACVDSTCAAAAHSCVTVWVSCGEDLVCPKVGFDQVCLPSRNCAALGLADDSTGELGGNQMFKVFCNESDPEVMRMTTEDIRASL